MSKSGPAKRIVHRLAFSVLEVTEVTGLGRSFIYEEIKNGRLRVRKAGRRSLIFEADLQAWLAKLPLVYRERPRSSP